jgi:drug/metabolite transporter (DMT)-like permease
MPAAEALNGRAAAPDAEQPAPAPAAAAAAAAPPRKLSQQRVAEASIAGVCVLWGGSFVVVKRAFDDASPMVFTALRFFLALAALLCLYGRRMRRERFAGAAVVGVLLFVGFSFQAAGLARTTPSRSAFLTAICIPMTPLFQAALLRRAPRAMELLGAALALVGTFMLTGGRSGGADADAPHGAAFNTGDVLSLACAVVFAFHMIAINHWGAGEGFATVAVGQVAVTAVLSALLCPLFETPALRLTPAVALAIAATGLLATALAFTVLVWAQTHTSATRAAIICATGERACACAEDAARAYRRRLTRAPRAQSRSLPRSFRSR